MHCAGIFGACKLTNYIFLICRHSSGLLFCGTYVGTKGDIWLRDLLLVHRMVYTAAATTVLRAQCTHIRQAYRLIHLRSVSGCGILDCGVAVNAWSRVMQCPGLHACRKVWNNL